MKLTARYAFPTIGALAVLSLVHWSRVHQHLHSPALLYLRGVLPNLVAEVAITFVLLAIWADQQKDFDFAKARRWCLISTGIATAGLIGWEFLQQGNHRLVFDPHDIGATLVGTGLSIGLFHWLTPKSA